MSPADSISAGRVAPIFVRTPEWVLLVGLSTQALSLYTTLLAHVNRESGTGIVWPGMDTLCELLGFKSRKSVSKYVKELVAVGAIDVSRKKGSMARHNVYVVHELPPEGYAGPMTLGEFYANRRKTAGQSPRGTGVPVAMGIQMGAATGTEMPQNQTKRTRRSELEEDSSLPARPHADARGRRGKPAAKTRRANRADYPPTDDWIQPDDPAGMVDAIVDHVETLYGEPGGLRALLLSKAEPNLDPETYEELPGTEAAPGHLMNLALKAGKWGTVDFAYINRQEQQGRGPDDPIDQDCPFWTDTRTRGVA